MTEEKTRGAQGETKDMPISAKKKKKKTYIHKFKPRSSIHQTKLSPTWKWQNLQFLY